MCYASSRLLRAACAVSIAFSVAPAAYAGDFQYVATSPVANEYAFASATGAAVQPGSGKVFVVDKTAKVVHRFSADGTHEAAWVEAGGEPFVEPSDVAVDTYGYVYVADAGRGYVYKLNAGTGALAEKIGSGLVDAVGLDWISSGGQQHIYVADKGAHAVKRFSDSSDTSTGYAFTAGGAIQAPEDVSVVLAPEIRLWVTDSAANKVFAIEWTGAVLTSWGASEGTLAGPVGIDLCSNGEVLVSDTSNTVRRFSQGGTLLSTFVEQGAGNGYVNSPARFEIDRANDYLWIADNGNTRAQRFTGAGAHSATFGAGAGGGDGQFFGPRRLDIDSAGNTYVADTLNHRIQRIDPYGSILTFGSQGYGAGELDTPWAVTADAAGNMYVADTMNHRILKFDPDGAFIEGWGSLGTGPAQFNEPKGVAVDANGYIYVADSKNYRVQKLDSQGEPVAQWTTYDEGGTAGSFFRPSDVAIGPDGHVYVYDGWGYYVVEMKPDGTTHRVWVDEWTGWTLSGQWSGIDVSPSGAVYVASGDSLWWLGPDESNGQVSTMRGTGSGQMTGASDVAVGPFGTLWVVDSSLHRLQNWELPDSAGPFTNYMDHGSDAWSSSDRSVWLTRPTDEPAGPVALYTSIDGADPTVLWSAAMEDTSTALPGFTFTEEGVHTLDFWAVDAYGNRETTRTVTARIDRTSPTATWTVDPADWTSAALVTAELECSDTLSGIDSVRIVASGATSFGPTDYDGPVEITNEGATSLFAEVTDAAGNKRPRGATVLIDRTGPTSTIWDVNAPGSTETPRTYSVSSYDAGSGVDATYYRIDGSLPRLGSLVHLSDPGTHTISYWSVDKVGNAESEQTTDVVVPSDSTPPEANQFYVDGERDWTNKTEAPVHSEVLGASEMRFSVDGSTWTEWVAYSAEATITLPAAEGECTVRAEYRDGAHNTVQRSDTISIDRTAPVTGSNKNDVVRVRPPAEITFVPSDAGGSGEAGTWYVLDNGPVTEGFSASTSDVGTHTVEFWSADAAGNVEERQVHQFEVVGETRPTTTTQSLSTTLVNYGGSVTAYGVPRDSEGDIIQGSGAVSLWARPYGGSWSRVKSATWDAVNSRYYAATTLRIGTDLQMRYDGEGENQGSEAAYGFVKARAAVGTPVAPTSARKGRKFTTYGSLGPSHATGTAVRIYRWRYVSGKWKSYSYVTAKTVSSGKYSISMSLPYTGKWRLKAYHADGGHYGAYSAKYDTITIK